MYLCTYIEYAGALFTDLQKMDGWMDGSRPIKNPHEFPIQFVYIEESPSQKICLEYIPIIPIFWIPERNTEIPS